MSLLIAYSDAVRSPPYLPIFSSDQYSVVTIITYNGFAGTFPGTYYLCAVVHYSPIVMGTGSALGMKRAQIELPKQDPLGETAMHKTSIVQPPSLTLASELTIPDSKMARAVTQLVRDTENTLLFNHSSRGYYFSAATSKPKGFTYHP